MNLLAYFRSLATKFLHRSRVDDDMEEELHSHIQHRAARLAISVLGNMDHLPERSDPRCLAKIGRVCR